MYHTNDKLEAFWGEKLVITNSFLSSFCPSQLFLMRLCAMQMYQQEIVLGVFGKPCFSGQMTSTLQLSSKVFPFGIQYSAFLVDTDGENAYKKVDFEAELEFLQRHISFKL